MFDLPCFDSRKSFYGKARVIEKDNGNKVLVSYDTEVCKITSKGEFVRLWEGESTTTIRHVNSFLQFYGIDGGGLNWWRLQPVKRKHRAGENPAYIYDAAGKIVGHKASVNF